MLADAISDGSDQRITISVAQKIPQASLIVFPSTGIYEPNGLDWNLFHGVLAPPERMWMPT